MSDYIIAIATIRSVLNNIDSIIDCINDALDSKENTKYKTVEELTEFTHMVIEMALIDGAVYNIAQELIGKRKEIKYMFRAETPYDVNILLNLKEFEL